MHYCAGHGKPCSHNSFIASRHTNTFHHLPSFFPSYGSHGPCYTECTKEQAHRLELAHPVLTPEQLAALKAMSFRGWETKVRVGWRCWRLCFALLCFAVLCCAVLCFAGVGVAMSNEACGAGIRASLGACK